MENPDVQFEMEKVVGNKVAHFKFQYKNNDVQSNDKAEDFIELMAMIFCDCKEESVDDDK